MKLGTFFALVVSFLLAGWLGWTAFEFAGALSKRRDAEQRLATTLDQLEEIQTLRVQTSSVSLGPRPDTDVVGRVHSALDKAGLSRAILREVLPQPDQSLGGDQSDGIRRRQVQRIVLSPLSADSLGELLLQWRKQGTVWRVTSIDFSRISRSDERDEDAYSATLTIAAEYVVKGADS